MKLVCALLVAGANLDKILKNDGQRGGGGYIVCNSILSNRGTED